MIAYCSYSQTDSITKKPDKVSYVDHVPARQLRNAIRMKDSFDLMKPELVLLYQVLSLHDKLQTKDSLLLDKSDSLNAVNNKLISNLQQQGDNGLEQQGLMQDQIDAMRIKIRKKNSIIIVCVAVIIEFGRRLLK
jgi:hypothetical protein